MSNAKFTTTWRPRAELPEPGQKIVVMALMPSFIVRRVEFVTGASDAYAMVRNCDGALWRWSQFDYWTSAAEFPPF